MADDKSPEQLQQEMFESALQVPATPEPPAEPKGSPSAAEPEKVPQAPVVPPPTPPTTEPEPAIPSWRLREEADARRRAEDHARQLETRLNEIQAQLRQATPEKTPDFFENPDQATMAVVAKVLQPYAEETRSQLMALGRMVASNVHGQDKVDAAEQAFLDARDKRTLDPMDYERVVQSPNRYDAVVQWHKRQNVLSSVGDDPAAWFEKQLETRMSDPKFQAALMEKIRGNAAEKPTAVKLPPSLSGKTAAADSRPEAVGDLSDASLFRYAMSPGRDRQ